MRAFLLILLALVALPAQAGEAQWIGSAKPAPVLHFRKDVTFDTRPATGWVDVSADNRFILYVNGQRAGMGPATSDLGHWRHERINIAPFLKPGPNSIAAVVWNFVVPNSDDLNVQTGPFAQQSAGSGFYLAAEDAAQTALDSGTGWNVSADQGHTPQSGSKQLNVPTWTGYYVAGAPESIDASKADWDWQMGAVTGDKAVVVPARATTPDPLPAQTFQRIDNGRLVRGNAPGFPAHPLVVPPHSHVTLLVERATMVAAFPQLQVSQGAGATIKLTYAEALYDKDGNKGVRDVVADNQIRGISDTFLVDGQPRLFEPLHWRVWRFLQFDIETQEAPLRLDSFRTYETGYPFVQAAQFSSNDADLNRIWDIGWKTARLDAHETYMDSAYWEQLQYVGDTRIQMLISYAVTGDPKLAVNAIDAFGWSNSNNGLTEGAYPSRGKNPIAPFSLLWIGMMHDYWMQQPDTAPVVRNLPRMREVIAWFRPYVQSDGLLSRNPTWNFVDWVDKPRDQFPSFDAAGESCLTTFGYLGALQQAADLENALGDKARAADDGALAATLKAGVRAKCWDSVRGLFADDPSKTLFSQHSNALAIIYDVATPDEAPAILGRITTPHGIDAPTGIIPVSYYFSWYIVRAMAHSGQSDRYLGLLDTWRDLLKLHFVTWPEARTHSRSDSHAWSAHPTADLLGIVAGIGPDAPGYATVRIAPHLGALKTLHAVAMTPSGPVTVDYNLYAKVPRAIIQMPGKLTGTFVWKGKVTPVSGKMTSVDLGG